MERNFPFLWVTGKNCDFGAEIKAIADCGIKSFCVESRVHPDFCGEGWWKDFDEILLYAQMYDMKVWILDDVRYPTGHANYKVQAHPELRQWHLVADHYDLISDGQTMQARICPDEEDILLGAFAVPYLGDTLRIDEAIDVSDGANGNWLICDLPKGEYRFVFIYRSRRSAEYETPFIDMLNPASVDLLIHEVYEKFYERYAPLFGSRIVGFFSDEPRVGSGYTQLPLVQNTPREHTLGLIGAAYPYSERVIELMKQRLPNMSVRDLLGIWYETENAAIVRCAFMDAVTSEYAKHFSGKLGAWCKAHGVYYAGHIVEDMDAHATTGRSAGHYFRSQAGQDLAGVDVVLHQIKAYSTDRPTIGKVFGGRADPTFYLHTLPALAVSEAWLDEQKKGSVCEIFGAFGWGESIREMKWMLDVMLAAGIDHFIPHAFCPELDNEDCPPHFYEGGKNPLYRPFVALMAYMDEVLALTGGHVKPKVGVLYHTEAEWSGKPFHLVDGVCRALNERQIPFIILPWERLETAGIETLIVPFSEYLPPWVCEAIARAKDAGVRVLSEKDVAFDDLADAYNGQLRVQGAARGVRILDCENPFIFQTGETETVAFVLEADGEYALYDPMNGVKTPVEKEFSLRLERGETRILLRESVSPTRYGEEIATTVAYRLELEENGAFVCVDERARVGSVNAIMPDYSGCVRYTCTVDIPQTGEYEWTFSAIGGALELFIDGVSQGFRFCAPAVYRVKGLAAGEHKITYAFYNTLANVKKDALSLFKEIEAFGLVQAPVIKRLIV